MPDPSDNRVTAALYLLERAKGQATTAVLSEPSAAAAFRIATELASACSALAAEIAGLRAIAIGSMRKQGLSYGQIGERLGISKARAAQLSQPDLDSKTLF